MEENPTYESAGPRVQENTAGGSASRDGSAAPSSSESADVYSTVNKHKPSVVDTTNNNIYAEVDKTKKTKAKKQGICSYVHSKLTEA